MSQSSQKVQPPRTEHVVHEDKLFWGEDPDVVRDIYLPHVYVSYHQLCVCWWDEAVFFHIPIMDVILVRY